MSSNNLDWRKILAESWALMKGGPAVVAFLLLLLFEFPLLGRSQTALSLLSGFAAILTVLGGAIAEVQFADILVGAGIAAAGFLLSIVVRAAFIGRATGAPLFGYGRGLRGLRLEFRSGLKKLRSVIVAVLIIIGLQFLALHGVGLATATTAAGEFLSAAASPSLPELPGITTAAPSPVFQAAPQISGVAVALATGLGFYDIVQKFGKPLWPAASVDFCLLGLSACVFGAVALLSPLLLIYFALAFFALFIIQEVLGGKGAPRAVKESFSLIYRNPIAALTLWALSLAIFVAISAAGWGLGLAILAISGNSLISTIIYHAASVFALLFILALQSRAWLEFRK